MAGEFDVNLLLLVNFKSEIEGLRSVFTDLRLQISGLGEEFVLDIDPE
jgi:hypothetical protein